MEKTYVLFINVKNCRGCRSCQLACSFKNEKVFNAEKSVIRMDRDVITGNTVPVILPLDCDFCGGEPACLAACTYDAISIQERKSETKIVVCM